MKKKEIASKMFKTHKAVGGTMTFMTKEHPEMKKHEAHEKLLESRKASYQAFRKNPTGK